MDSQPPPLVGIEINGGLGNQLFEYAAVMALSRRLKAELCCDSYRAASDPGRPLGLGEFGLGWREVEGPRRRGALRAAGRALGWGRRSPFAGATYFEEQEGSFNPAFMDLAAPCFLKGYFQSWRYFAGHEEDIRTAFDLDKLPGGPPAIEAKIREAACPVAVHVRRGDFSDTPENAALRGPLGVEYYRRARDVITSALPDATFFLFSDEPGTAMAELSDWTDLIPVNGTTAHQDFRLMAMCRHFIIANSTFSWWAAWLGKSPDKMVVAPRVWFGPAHRQAVVVEDLIPPLWRTI